MEKQISIIIPTYNMEKYIGRCLNSLLIPEIDQVEVLVVNDGSKDRSSEIAHSYAERYPDSIKVIDKPNGNYGSCINTALPLCTGRYVKVLDADDTFDTEAFSKFVMLLTTTDSDVVVTPYFNIDSDGKIIRTDKIDYPGLVLYKVYQIKDVDERVLVMSSAMHRLAYKADIFNRFAYHQTEGVSYTDNQWDKIPLAYATTIQITDIYLYRYLLGREGQTMDPKQRMKSMGHIITVAQDMISMYETNAHAAPLHDFLYNRILLFAMTPFYLSIIESKPEDMKQLCAYDEFLKIYYNSYFKALEEMPYNEICSFKFIKDIRSKRYPTGYKIPYLVRVKMSITARTKSVISTMRKLLGN